jgi:hypothetical protein
MRSIRWVLRGLPFAALVLAGAPLFAQGGPPLVTDDPDTPGPRHWEINTSLLREKTLGARESEEPRLDLNYGVGRRVQLKLEAPWLSRREDGAPSESGWGNTVAGVKWRFLGEEGKKIAWAVYPQYEFNTSRASVRKGLVEDGHALLLPTEITLELRHVEMNVEVGRDFVSKGPSGWVYGLATEVGVVHRLELLGEIHGENADGSPAVFLLNAGARFKATRQVTLMFAIGHAVSGPAEERPRLLVYAGIQLNLPDTFDFTRPRPRG